jgi:hypothetical protein
MYDPDDDIKKAKIGKKEEPLHEVIHKKKAETNLPPLRIRKTKENTRKKQDVYSFQELPIQQMPAVTMYCKCTGCTHSNVDGWQLYTCDRCGLKFCHTHHLYEDHKCNSNNGLLKGLKKKIKDIVSNKEK